MILRDAKLLVQFFGEATRFHVGRVVESAGLFCCEEVLDWYPLCVLAMAGDPLGAMLGRSIDG